MASLPSLPSEKLQELKDRAVNRDKASRNSFLIIRPHFLHRFLFKPYAKKQTVMLNAFRKDGS